MLLLTTRQKKTRLKSRVPKSPLRVFLLHQVRYCNKSVVDVLVVEADCSVTGSSALSKRISNHAVSSLEADLRLECVLAYRADHLQGHVWAVEDTSIKGT